MVSAFANRRSGCIWAALTVTACGTPLPDWGPRVERADAASPDAATEARLTFDPHAPPTSVTPVTHITVEIGRALAEPRVVLVEGAITSTQLRELSRPALTQTLAARLEPTLVWSSSATSLVVAPLRSLTRSALYTVGISDPPVALSFTVTSDDALPVLPRVWPDPEAPAFAGSSAVWCASSALPDVTMAATLAPAAVAGRIARGTGASLIAAQCVSWFALPGGTSMPPSAAAPAVAPTWVDFGAGAMALLEPVLLWPHARMPEPAPMTCDAVEVPFGPACAIADDDRIVVRPSDGPVLWTFDGGGSGATVRSSRGGRSFVVRPMPPDRRFRVATLDESGRRVEEVVMIQPMPPRAHVVINEVMANPAGSEPEQEWVELFNDGLFPTAVTGYGLETGAGTAILPAGVLAPGAFALVVPSDYVDDDGVDPVPAPGTLIVRVPTLGRDGLSNEGERLLLRDAAGTAVSSFPAMKAKSGVSNARISPDAPDGNADSFAPSRSGSATPGAANWPP
jgi:hypothetical protein